MPYYYYFTKEEWKVFQNMTTNLGIKCMSL